MFSTNVNVFESWSFFCNPFLIRKQYVIHEQDECKRLEVRDSKAKEWKARCIVTCAEDWNHQALRRIEEHRRYVANVLNQACDLVDGQVRPQTTQSSVAELDSQKE